MRYFTKDHEWLVYDEDVATVGITDFAQHQLGDVVFVELPAIGKMVKKGEDAGVVESVKAASEVFAPIDGEVVAVNQSLAAHPELVNQDPEGAAWFFKMKPTNPEMLQDLMDRDAYDDYVKGIE